MQRKGEHALQDPAGGKAEREDTQADAGLGRWAQQLRQQQQQQYHQTSPPEMSAQLRMQVRRWLSSLLASYTPLKQHGRQGASPCLLHAYQTGQADSRSSQNQNQSMLLMVAVYVLWWGEEDITRVKVSK